MKKFFGFLLLTGNSLLLFLFFIAIITSLNEVSTVITFIVISILPIFLARLGFKLINESEKKVQKNNKSSYQNKKEIVNKEIKSSSNTIVNKKEFLMNYVDQQNNETERKISVFSIEEKSNDSYISAYCHLRKTNRTFKFSRIALLVALDTGEVIDSIDALYSNLQIISRTEHGEESNNETKDNNSSIEVETRNIKSTIELNKLFNRIRFWTLSVNNIESRIKYYKNKCEIIEEIIITQINKIDDEDFSITYSTENKTNTIDIALIEGISDLGNTFFSSDVSGYLALLCEKSNEYINEVAIKNFELLIDILVYISRADGRMLKKERDVISRFILKHNPDVSIGLIDDELKKWKSSYKNFDYAINKINKGDKKLLESLIIASQEIIETDKVSDPLEEEAINRIKELC